MDVEAKRIMALSISKLYSLRTQRGGLRLHRSLLLSMTMRAARDIYHTAQQLRDAEEEEQVVPCAPEATTEEPMEINKDSPQVAMKPQEHEETLEDDKENQCSSERHSRKRRGKTALEPDFLPLKKARMDTDEEKQHPQGEVLRTNNGNSCRQIETLTAFATHRAIVAC
ncbi:immediate early response 2b [Pseudorasbora parva]|uniref:immediate early response 2b n=1 Tax=Pseudorasbora parva TaxID=51549 RepID=UPI00351F561B